MSAVFLLFRYVSLCYVERYERVCIYAVNQSLSTTIKPKALFDCVIGRVNHTQIKIRIHSQNGFNAIYQLYRTLKIAIASTCMNFKLFVFCLPFFSISTFFSVRFPVSHLRCLKI